MNSMTLFHQAQGHLNRRDTATYDHDRLARRRPIVETGLKDVVDPIVIPRRPFRPFWLFACAHGQYETFDCHLLPLDSSTSIPSRLTTHFSARSCMWIFASPKDSTT